MAEQCDWTKKKCRPCEGGIPPVPLEEARSHMNSLPGWQLTPGGKALQRHYVMKDFMAAMHFMGDIARVAEAEDHHPDLHLTSYKKLRIELSTHAIGGLSENDFILAAKIDQLPKELKQ